MYEDYDLESAFEDRYTIQGDWDAEDSDLDSDICDDCGCYVSDCDGTCMDEDEMLYPEWTERSYTH